MPTTTRSIFDTHFDVAVVGAGHAGVAAALTLADQDLTVALIERSADVAAESGRAFAARSGSADDARWQRLVADVTEMGGATSDWLDGALTEIVLNNQLRGSDISCLYNAAVVGVERDESGRVCASNFATRGGLKRIRAARWIDATESGELIRLLSDAQPRVADYAQIQLHLQHPRWEDQLVSTALATTAWPSERILSVEVDPASEHWRETALARLSRFTEELGADARALCLSHFSLEPTVSYSGDAPPLTLPSNVFGAAPAFADGAFLTPAERHALGVAAAIAAPDADGADESSPGGDIAIPAFTDSITTEVCVIGAGTGGLLAAVAAARSGAAVLTLEASGLIGGVGTAGGIHVYWFGAPGGLQAELDERTRELMHSMGDGPFRDGPFNPWAKMIASETLLKESGSQLLRHALFFEVERDADQVKSVYASTPAGVIRVEAATFIDATGDGDLCALASVPFRLARPSDSLFHAYSQSSGRLRMLRGEIRMDNVNFDAGYCDPTDPEDVTRARQRGIAAYSISTRYVELTRPTYIAPVLGIREGRHIETDYIITLDDLVSRRRFDDTIGYTASTFDNHATDMEFESNEAVFYRWVLEQSGAPIGCEISYRALVPQGLTNVWIGSRCLGLTQDAQYVIRMQRDIQRVGEVAGLAAAQSHLMHTNNRSIDIAKLQAKLKDSGALSSKPRALETRFGLYEREDDDGKVQFPATDATSEAFLGELPVGAIHDTTLAAVREALEAGSPNGALWWAYRHPQVYRPIVLEYFTNESSSDATTWLAAATLAMWGDPLAEPRLIRAVEQLEFLDERAIQRLKKRARPTAGPSEAAKTPPRWLMALTLLRLCGSEHSLDAIEGLLGTPAQALNTLTSMGITLTALAGRTKNPAALKRIADLVGQLSTQTLVGSKDYTARDVGTMSHIGATQHIEGKDHAALTLKPEPEASQFRNSYEDRKWQRDLVVGKARRALEESLDAVTES